MAPHFANQFEIIMPMGFILNPFSLIPLLTLPVLHPIQNPNKTLIRPLSFPNSIMSWACSSCTFLNPSSQKPNCQICFTPSSASSSSSISNPKWACKSCTFLNSYSRSYCEICDTRSSSLSSLSNFEDLDPVDDLGGSNVGSVFFPLRCCNQDTDGFRGLGVDQTLPSGNGGVKAVIELDGAWNSVSNKRKLQDSVSGNSNAINGVKRGKQAAIDLEKGTVSLETTENGKYQKGSHEIKILSYNVWFREDLEVNRRMQAIGDLIQLHSPDVICFQEVTPNIYSILQKSMWWKKYCCSVTYERAASETYFCMQLAKLPVKSFISKPFNYTAMGRELCIAEIQATQEKSLVIATSHLESPCPGPPTWDQMFSKERVNQAKEAIAFLQKYPNVLFCGDMNWDDKLDGKFPYVEGWFDAWEQTRPTEIGWTYDTKANKMLTGNRTLQKRLDRFICHLADFKIRSIEMIGTEEIKGLTYNKQKKMKNKIQELTLPILPSDHYGLLVTISNSNEGICFLPS